MLLESHMTDNKWTKFSLYSSRLLSMTPIFDGARFRASRIASGHLGGIIISLLVQGDDILVRRLSTLRGRYTSSYLCFQSPPSDTSAWLNSNLPARKPPLFHFCMQDSGTIPEVHQNPFYPSALQSSSLIGMI